jgi:adenine-specific DNA-methyltransferase
MENLLDNLKQLLKKDERLISEDELLKNKIIELAIKLDKDLIKLLMSDKNMKDVFFVDIYGTLIFDKDKFIRFVSNKQFLPDSYTAFKNKIGLIDEKGEFISEKKDVVISWPYKDCVLEGGMTKEDQKKRDEIFWNEILAPDEISRLLDPKVFTNAKRIEAKGEHKLDKFKTDENGNIKDNLIIKGNNLLVLHSLKKRFTGKIKLIYIDPPYNTGNDEFKYNDAFNHSTWLTFMKNRLEVAKKMLIGNGMIFVSCDDNEQAYLKTLLDEIFKRENFVSCLVWKSNPRGRAMDKFFATTKEYILVYAKDITQINISMKVIEDTKKIEKYKYKDDISLYKKGYPLHNGTRDFHINNRPNLAYSIYYNPDTKDAVVKDEKMKDKKGLYYIDENYIDKELEKKGYIRIIPKVNNQTKRRRVWRWGTEKFLREYKTELLFVKEYSGYYIYQKDRLSRMGEKHEKYKDIIEGIRTDEGGLEIQELLGKKSFAFPKPLKLLKHLFSVVDTKKDSIIMDFFSGSGTTAQAVLELNKEDGGNRQFILCEQLDYVDTVTIPRVKKVIEKLGGCNFVYLELMKWNENFVEKIQKAKTKDEAKKLWETMKEKAFLSYKVDIKAFDENAKDFADLSLEDQKRFLLECLDKNHLYVNYSEIDDEEYGISEEDKKLNREFYGNSK